jgi:hypothetical protein
MKGKNTIFSGFIQAITVIGEEISNKSLKKPEIKIKSDKIDVSKVIELDLKNFFCLISDIKELRTVLILKSRSSKRLKQLMFNFTLAVYLKISKTLENFEGEVSDYPDTILPLIDEYFDIFYKESFVTNYQENDLSSIKKKYKLSKLQFQIMITIFSLLKEKRSFRLLDILEKLSDKNEDSIIDAIETSLENRLIIPYVR